MAKQIIRGKFLLIECTAGELMNAVGSGLCICDWCGKSFLPSEKGATLPFSINGTVKSALKNGLNVLLGILRMSMLSVRILSSMLPGSESNVSKC